MTLSALSGNILNKAQRVIKRALLVSGSANFSTRDVWDGYRLGLEVAGLEVIPYPTFSMLKMLSVDAVCADIIGTALDVSRQIDCVIFIDGLFFRKLREKVPLSIRKAGIPTVLVATDDPYDDIGKAKTLYHYRFSNEIHSADDVDFYLPTATIPPPVVPVQSEPTYDLSFLGTVFDDRLPFLIEMAKHCQQNDLRMVIAGKFVSDPEPFHKFDNVELRSRTIDAVEKWELYADSKVTLNLFRQAERRTDSPSPRIFEVTAYGHAALLTGPYRSEVERIYGDTVYHFRDFEEAITQLNIALADSTACRNKVQRAQEITLHEHLYHHRAEQLVKILNESIYAEQGPEASEHRLAWVIGSGRSGSTWLGEMLGSLPGIQRWHEPYFGRLFRYLSERPEELDRPASFYSRRYQETWFSGLRELFFNMVRERFPTFGRQALVVKEVNTPELFPWIRHAFPSARLIFLARDPFDTLDSYLDLQAPGSWNERFVEEDTWLSAENVTRTCEYIQAATLAAVKAYEACPEQQRLRVNYEDLLVNAAEQLIACGELINTPVTLEAAQRVVEHHRFEHHTETGPGKFRRKGQAGVWRESQYFTPEVLEIAQRILGPLRTRLGYQESSKLRNTDVDISG